MVQRDTRYVLGSLNTVRVNAFQVSRKRATSPNAGPDRVPLAGGCERGNSRTQTLLSICQRRRGSSTPRAMLLSARGFTVQRLSVSSRTTLRAPPLENPVHCTPRALEDSRARQHFARYFRTDHSLALAGNRFANSEGKGRRAVLCGGSADRRSTGGAIGADTLNDRGN